MRILGLILAGALALTASMGRSSLLLLLACGDSQVHRLRRSALQIATNQRSDQVQERLMLGMSAASAQEGADVEIGHMAARWDVRLVSDK